MPDPRPTPMCTKRTPGAAALAALVALAALLAPLVGAGRTADTGRPAARAMGHALGWDAGGPAGGGMDLAHDLFATWSLFEKPAR